MTSVLKPNDYFPSGDITLTRGKFKYTLGGRTHYTYESIGRERTSYVATRTLTESGDTALLTQQDSLVEVIHNAHFPWQDLIERTLLSDNLYDLLIEVKPYLKDVVRFSKPAPSELAETLEWLKTPRGIVRLRYVSGLERPYVFDRWSGSATHESLDNAIAALPAYDLQTFFIDHTTPKPFVEQLRVSLLGRWVREVNPSGCPAATRLQSQLTLLSTDEGILATIQSVSLKDLYTIWEDTNTQLSFRILCKTFVDYPMTTKEALASTPPELSPETLEWLKTPRGWAQVCYTGGAYPYSTKYLGAPQHYTTFSALMADHSTLARDLLEQVHVSELPSDLAIICKERLFRSWVNDSSAAKYEADLPDDIREFLNRMRGFSLSDMLAALQDTEGTMLSKCADGLKVHRDFRSLCNLERRSRRNNEVQESTKVKVETMTKKAAMDMIKEDGTDAAVRIGATQLTRAAQMSLSGILKAQGMKGPQIKAFIAFLNTDLGKICIKGALAGMLTYGPEIISEDPRGQLLAKEFRIQTMADSGNLIADLLMENLGPALMTTLASIPEPQKTRVVDEKPAVQHEDPEIQVAAKAATA